MKTVQIMLYLGPFHLQILDPPLVGLEPMPLETPMAMARVTSPASM